MCQAFSHLTLLVQSLCSHRPLRRPVAYRALPTAISGCFQQPLPVASFSHFLLSPLCRGISWCCAVCTAYPGLPWTVAMGFPRPNDEFCWVPGPCLVFFSPVALSKCCVHRKPLKNNFWSANFPQTVRSPTSGQGVEFSTHLQSPVCFCWAACNQRLHLVLRCRAGESKGESRLQCVEDIKPW